MRREAGALRLPVCRRGAARAGCQSELDDELDEVAAGVDELLSLDEELDEPFEPLLVRLSVL